MKVLHIITGLNTGGAEMMLLKILSHLATEKLIDSAVISLTDKGTIGEKIESLGIPVYTLKLNSIQGILQLPITLCFLVKHVRPDLIQGWMYHGNLIASLASFFSGSKIRVLWNIRYSLYSLAHEKRTTVFVIRLGSFFSRFTDGVIYNSKTSRLQHENLGFSSSKSLIIPNGFDTDQFKPSLSLYKAVRNELGISPNSIIIGHFARFHPMKDHENFFKAASFLLDQHKRQDLYFLLCGLGVCWNNTKIAEIIQSLKLDKKRFFLLGERSDVYRLTAALDIATVSSCFGEAFPNVIGEAMACGVPCVVTDVGDSAWIIGDTGQVVAPRDPVALAQALQHLLSIGYEGRNQLGQTAREEIQKRFSIDYIAEQYLNLYQDA